MLLSFKNPAADCVCVRTLLLYNQPTQYVAIGAYHPYMDRTFQRNPSLKIMFLSCVENSSREVDGQL